MTSPGPGPKPAGPTGPTPTGPGPQRGHLPIGIDSDPREARRATGPGSASSVAMVAAGVGQLPRLGQVIRDAERLAAQLISVLERDYDVASAPSAEDDPTGLGFVEVRLMSARADVRSALLMLDQITTLGLPPTGSAVMFPARQSTNSASLPGGPPNHLAVSSVAASVTGRARGRAERVAGEAVAVKPYYADDSVTLWHGDCRETTDWLAADVLVTDPPYGIGWKRGLNLARASMAHSGIANDHDTSARDASLEAWDGKPALCFGSFFAPQPEGVKAVLVYRKPPDAGVVGSTTGWRRDMEPIFVLGAWPSRPAKWSSLVTTVTGGVGNLAARTGHPHTKPLDVMEQLVDACPPGMIADPFAGSGSTLVAARNLGRKAIGVELDERYCEIAARRLAQDVLPIAGAL